MIATMAMNMPNEEDDCRTTLIVVPAALLLQGRIQLESRDPVLVANSYFVVERRN